MATGSDIAATQQNTSIPLVGKAFFESNLGTSTEFAFSNAHTDNNLSGFKNLTDKTEDKRQKKEDRFSYIVSRMTDTGFALSKQDMKDILDKQDLDDPLSEDQKENAEITKEQLAKDPEANQKRNEKLEEAAAESDAAVVIYDEEGVGTLVSKDPNMQEEVENAEVQITTAVAVQESESSDVKNDTELQEQAEEVLDQTGEKLIEEKIEEDLGLDGTTTSVASDMMGDGGAPVTSMGDFSAAAAPVTNPTTGPTIEQPVITPVTQDVNIPSLQ